MFGLIERALAFSACSGGAFDISYASVGQLYDYRARIAPGAAALATRARRDRLAQPASSTAPRARWRFAHPGMRIDLGGFAKGHAVDNAVAILRAPAASPTPSSAPAATAASSATAAAGPGRSASATRARPRRGGACCR